MAHIIDQFWLKKSKGRLGLQTFVCRFSKNICFNENIRLSNMHSVFIDVFSTVESNQTPSIQKLQPIWQYIFVGSLDAVYRESTKILCSVQNDQTSEACTKVLRNLNFVHRRAAGKPCTMIEVQKHFCTTPSWFLSFCSLLRRIFVLRAVWQEPTVIFSCQWTLCMLLSGSNLSEFDVFGHLKFKMIDFEHCTGVIRLCTGH